MTSGSRAAAEPSGALQVLAAATRLGVTSFGGPIAHLGYFHDEYVVRRRWLDKARYADLVALCQFLPGPASSQVGIAVGVIRAGLLGGVMAWLGFTLPSAVLLVAFAYGMQAMGPTDAGWLHGIKVVAVAVVAQAVCVVGTLPFWDVLRGRAGFQAALQGINAAVVGLLLAALYDPVWTSAVRGPADFGLAHGRRGGRDRGAVTWREPQTARGEQARMAAPSGQ